MEWHVMVLYLVIGRAIARALKNETTNVHLIADKEV
jgi:hypothetical protein